jgi:hypothetical protein
VRRQLGAGALEIVRRRPGGFLVDVGDQNPGALGREYLRHGAPDALAGAGDDARFALQPVSHAPSSAIDARELTVRRCAAPGAAGLTTWPTGEVSRPPREKRFASQTEGRRAYQAMVPIVLRKRARV